MKTIVRKTRNGRTRKKIEFPSLQEAREWVRDDSQYTRKIHAYLLTTGTETTIIDA